MESIVNEYGYEYSSIDNERYFGNISKDLFCNAIMLRSGRDALKAVASQHPNCTVLLPALSCQSMISPFSLFGHSVRYYMLKPDLTADLDSIHTTMSEIGDTTLFVYMNYFGIKSIKEDDLNAISSICMVHGMSSMNKNKVVMIEDRTHDLFSEYQNCFLPDYTLASIRKWIAVPDGALLWIKEKKCPDVYSDDSFWKIRLHAQEIKSLYHTIGDQRLKLRYRKMFSEASSYLDTGQKPVRMSTYSEKIINYTDFSSIMEQRKKNAKMLINEINRHECIKIIQSEVGQSDLYVPFFVMNRDEIQRRLAELGIYCTVIWPLSEEQKNVCNIARRIDEQMLAAPCDQRYNEEDMKLIGKTISSICDRYSV